MDLLTIKWSNGGEMRRFSLEKVTCDALRAKIKELIPEFEGKLGWKDTDGDLILIECDSDLNEAIQTDTNESVVRIFTIGENNSTETLETHTNVSCDNCLQNPLIGTRYRCTICADYDLCVTCKQQVTHEHPMEEYCKMAHNGKLCDACRMNPITGTRYKCRVCVDYDLCQSCRTAGKHTEHEFDAILPPPLTPVASGEPSIVHEGIFCDGCEDDDVSDAEQKWIRGLRHKCLVCPDYDLCHGCFEKGKHRQHTMHTIERPQSDATAMKMQINPLATAPPVVQQQQSASAIKVRNLHILSDIQARFATTHVYSQMVNRIGRSQEVTFSVELPEEAFITKFQMIIDGQIVDGEIRKKKDAAAIYRQAKTSGHSSSLIKKTANREMNLFSISVNVSAYSKVHFKLTYQEVLRRQHNVYKHVVNVHPCQPVDDIQVQVRIAEKQPISGVFVPKFGSKIAQMTNKDLVMMPKESNATVTSDTTSDFSLANIHFKPTNSGQTDGQLVVLYDVKREHNGGHIDTLGGYFVHYIAPSEVALGTKHVCFVLDRSGSMSGKKIEQTKHAMRLVLGDLNQRDMFTIVTFDDIIDVSRTAVASADNVRQAIEFVNNIQARSTTALHGAIQKGLEVLQQSSAADHSMVVFLTDGEPNVGVTDGRQIVDRLAMQNSKHRHGVHGISFGSGSDHRLVQRIAAANRGMAKMVYEDSDADLQLKGFLAEISSPLLREVSVSYVNGAVDVGSLVCPSSTTSDHTTTLYAGTEVALFGRLLQQQQTQPFSGTVTGYASEGKLEKLFAQCQINDDRPRVFDFGNSVCCKPCFLWPHEFYLPPKKVPEADTLGGFVERMWAYETVRKLMRDAKMRWSQQEESQMLHRALELSLKYGFVTDQTSMVVVPPNAAETELWQGAPPFRQHSELQHMQRSAQCFSACGIAGAGRRLAGGGQTKCNMMRISSPACASSLFGAAVDGASYMPRRKMELCGDVKTKMTKKRAFDKSRQEACNKADRRSRSRSLERSRSDSLEADVMEDEDTSSEDDQDVIDGPTPTFRRANVKEAAFGLKSVLLLLDGSSVQQHSTLIDAAEHLLKLGGFNADTKCTLVAIDAQLQLHLLADKADTNTVMHTLEQARQNVLQGQIVSSDLLTTAFERILVLTSGGTLGSVGALLKYVRVQSRSPLFVRFGDEFTMEKRRELEDITGDQRFIVDALSKTKDIEKMLV